MNAPEDGFTKPIALHWHEDATSRVPYRTYTDAALYQEELKRLFTAVTGAMWAWPPKFRRLETINAPGSASVR